MTSERFGFIADEPEQARPELGRETVRALVAYLQALADVKGRQAERLGLPDDVFVASSEDCRVAAAVLTDIYWFEASD